MKRILIAFLIAVPVAMVAAVVAWEAVWEPMCGTIVWSDQKSPNGKFAFSLFRRNCGATTDYATGVSIRRVGTNFDQSARDEVLLVDGDVPVTAAWIGSDRIEIDVPKGAEIFRSAQEWNGIAIRYVTH